ncbi:hypothetical protein EZJ43_10660 [Pedobacter changchengzhani]|uniref:Uncharacterized protein n=1 Tax=Pedobacter changchengzhani TaxID=2529274 RepID=A0A4R5MKN5_9SPHI|nr:hypothetical protein [Pedobacter changchengzhani]TDG36132.1 hypothetical protein EZJ43_10660 [Pedobacter changchengzhani]
MKYKKLILVVGILLSIPLIMFLVWIVYPKTKFVLAIVDKTVLDKDAQEHVSLSWILNYEKYAKTSEKRYQADHDYYGFFPEDKNHYSLKGLERFSEQQLDQLSIDADAVYFTDTYGVYTNEWYTERKKADQNAVIYGGLSKQDLVLLNLMKKKHKLIISEFNTIGSPTKLENRLQFEKLFAMRWTGWTARYFSSLDTSKNSELPRWLIKNYENTHQKKWKFKRSGIAFVNEAAAVVILEDTTHLTQPIPSIETSITGQSKYNLPASIKYPFWFDVIVPDTLINHAVSKFKIATNLAGQEELKRFGIPQNFPAVLEHDAPDYRFFYFSGDFCDNPVSIKSSYFKGIRFLDFLFYNRSDAMDRSAFFWTFYRPMLTEILKESK